MVQGNFSEAIEILREVMSIHDSLKTSPEFRARSEFNNNLYHVFNIFV
jgi:hypothetical protein